MVTTIMLGDILGHEILDEDSHIEWTMFQKLAKVNGTRRAIQRDWSSIDEKLNTLCRECRGGKIIGVAARECLTAGGNKHLMWVDIDTADRLAVEAWLLTQPILPRDSYRHVTSSTLNSHIYVATDRPLSESQQPEIKRLLAMSMPSGLRRKMDRVYGPETQRVIFLPTEGLTRGVLPQHLARGLTRKFILPDG